MTLRLPNGRHFILARGLAWGLAGATAAISGCLPTATTAVQGESPYFQMRVTEDHGLEPLRTSLNDSVPKLLSAGIFDAVPGKTGHHGPTVTALGNGDLLAAWFAYVGDKELTQADVYRARWSALNAAWSTPELWIDRELSVANPVLYSEGSDIWLFFTVVPFGWSTAHVEQMRSRDGGVTWSGPRVINEVLGANVRYPPIRLASGELLLPSYDDLFGQTLLLASADGERWRPRAVLAPPFPERMIQASIARTAEGILLVGRNPAQGALWTGWTGNGSDGGFDGDGLEGGGGWTLSLSSGFPNPGTPAALLTLRSGNVLMVFNDSTFQRRPLSATLSSDQGRSWTPARAIIADVGNWAYPSVAQSSDGIIELVYSHDRQRIQHVRLNEAWLLERGRR